MEPIANETWKSITRSRRRQRLLLLLASLGEAYLGQLARSLGTNAWTVRCLLHGRPPYYAVELALIPLGLVREKPTARGRAYEITTRGRRKARSMTSARARRAAQRAPVAGQAVAKVDGQEGGSATWSVDAGQGGPG